VVAMFEDEFFEYCRHVFGPLVHSVQNPYEHGAGENGRDYQCQPNGALFLYFHEQFQFEVMKVVEVVRDCGDHHWFTPD
jgi:hypothetical protein